MVLNLVQLRVPRSSFNSIWVTMCVCVCVCVCVCICAWTSLYVFVSVYYLCVYEGRQGFI